MDQCFLFFKFCDLFFRPSLSTSRLVDCQTIPRQEQKQHFRYLCAQTKHGMVRIGTCDNGIYTRILVWWKTKFCSNIYFWIERNPCTPAEPQKYNERLVTANSQDRILQQRRVVINASFFSISFQTTLPIRARPGVLWRGALQCIKITIHDK